MILSACQRFTPDSVPSGWVLEPIGKRIALEYGSALTENDRRDGNYPVYGSNGRVGSHDSFLVEGPGILVGRKGSVGEVHFSEENFWPIDTVYFVRCKGSDNPRFLAYLLEFLNLGRLNAATGVPGLTRRDALFMLGAFPDESEQTRIAETLKAADDHIHALEEQIRKAERVKRAVLQSFPCVIKHGLGKPLFRVADISSGFTKGRDLSGYETLTVAYLTVVNVLDGAVDLTDVSEAEIKVSELEDLRLRDGDVLMTEGGDRDKLGRGTIWQAQIDPIVCQNHIFRVRPRDEELRSWFLHYLLQAPSSKRYFCSAAKQTSNLCTINSRDLRRFEVPNLSPEEQDTWVERLRTCDEMLAKLGLQLNAARRVKQSLLQNLLTGRIRLKP